MSNTPIGSEEPKDPVGIDGKEVQLPPSSKRRFVRLDYKCSFCNKMQDEVKRLIAGPNKVYICDECVILCMEIFIESGMFPDEEVSEEEGVTGYIRQLREQHQNMVKVRNALNALEQMCVLAIANAEFLPLAFTEQLVEAAEHVNRKLKEITRSQDNLPHETETNTGESTDDSDPSSSRSNN